MFATRNPQALLLALCLVAAWLSIPVLADGERQAELDRIYSTALDKAVSAEEAGRDDRSIAWIYLRAADESRDKGGTDHTIRLYQAAVSADPNWAHARRVFGDYLMGYRGLYEYAAEQYYEALRIVEEQPEAHDAEFRRLLNRSLQILHRDGKDGVPLYTSPAFSLFADGSVGYRRAAPPITPVAAGDGSLVGQQQKLESFITETRLPELNNGIDFLHGSIDANNEGLAFFRRAVSENDEGLEFFGDKLESNEDGIAFFEQLLAADPANPDAADWQAAVDALEAERETNAERVDDIETDKGFNQSQLDTISRDKTANQARLQDTLEERAEAQQQRDRAAHYAERRRSDLVYRAGILLRFGHTALPYVRADWEQVDGERVDINLDSLDDPLDRKFDRYALTLGKHILLPNSVDLTLEGEIARSELKFYDPFNRVRLAREEGTHYGVDADFAKHFGFNTLRLKLGGAVSDIENDVSDDDRAYRGHGAVRLSAFPPPERIQPTERFKGRRSTHIELGLAYSRRDFKAPGEPTLEEDVYRPYISYEELALCRGWLDLTLVYDWRRQSLSEAGDDASVASHNFTLLPALVPIYRLYDNTFWTGVEHMTIGFPVTLSVGDGDFDRYALGIRVFTRYVTAWGVAITPILSADYHRYWELDEDDWGVYLKCALSSGAWEEVPVTGGAAL